MRKDWFGVTNSFENALTDIAEITNESKKSSLESWYEVLKKVMRLWEGNDVK